MYIIWLERLGGDVIAHSAADVQIFENGPVLNFHGLENISSSQDGMGCALVDVNGSYRDAGTMESFSLRWFPAKC